jgi:tripartite-type tricarboxylate transporter receptor subunit TctC
VETARTVTCRRFNDKKPPSSREDSMQLPRRQFLHWAAGAAALPALSRRAWSQAYPARPIHLIVTFPPGSAPDIIARLVGEWLSARLGQQFVIENKPGAGGNIATEYVVRAAPDGYTLLMPVSTNAVNATLYPNLSFNFVRDIVPVAGIATTPFIVLLTPSFPAKTVPELIAYAKANPGKINMSSGGVGSSPHVFGELFQIMTETKFVHVPYRGSYTTDMISGQIHLGFVPIAQALPLIRSGQLRALATTTAKRNDVLPDVPTIGEFLPGYEAFGWYGLGVPKDTPAEIIKTLSDAMNAALADPNTKKRLVDLGVDPMPLDSARFAKHITDETEKWAKVIKTAGIKLN